MASSGERQIDDLDFAILSQLQSDGRKPFTEIADSLGVAVGTVRNRVTKMIDAGVLRIIAAIDPYSIGFNAYGMILIAIEPECLEQAVNQLTELPEMFFLAIKSGVYNIVIDVMCRDIEHLSELLIKRLPKVAGFKDYEMHLYLRMVRWGQPKLHPTLANNHNKTSNK